MKRFVWILGGKKSSHFKRIPTSASLDCFLFGEGDCYILCVVEGGQAHVDPVVETGGRFLPLQGVFEDGNDKHLVDLLGQEDVLGHQDVPDVGRGEGSSHDCDIRHEILVAAVTLIVRVEVDGECPPAPTDERIWMSGDPPPDRTGQMPPIFLGVSLWAVHLAFSFKSVQKETKSD